MAPRVMLNCWLVAMWLWIQSRGRSVVWVLRSRHSFGLLPHFGIGERLGFRSFRSIEYVPPRRRLWSRQDKGLLFCGHYVVKHYKLVSVRRWATKEQAMADHYIPRLGGKYGG